MEAEEYDAYIAVPLNLTQPLLEKEEQEEEKSSWVSCGENCLLAILPCLLFIQFGVAYLSNTPPQIHWVLVNLGIVCFIVMAFAFRRAFSEPESLVALIPEVLIDVILGLILFEKTELAATVMFGSILFMGFVSVIKLAFAASNRQDEEMESTESLRGDFNA